MKQKQKENSEFLVKLTSLAKALVASYKLEKNPKTKVAIEGLAKAIRTIKAAPIEEVKEEPNEELFTIKPIETELSSKEKDIKKKLTVDLQGKTVGLEHENENTGVKTTGKADIEKGTFVAGRKNKKTGVESTAKADIKEGILSGGRKNKKTGVETTGEFDIKKGTLSGSRKNEKTGVETSASLDVKNGIGSINTNNDKTGKNLGVEVNVKDKVVAVTSSTKKTGTENKLTIDAKKGIIGFESKNEEKGQAITAQLSKAGIKVGVKKEITVELTTPPAKIGIFSLALGLELKAGFTFNADILRDKVGLRGEVDFIATGKLDAYINAFDYFEFGGSLSITYKTKLDAEVYLTGNKGMFRLEESNHNIKAKIDFFLRPGKKLVEYIQTAYDLWMEISRGGGDKKFNKNKMAWVIPLSTIDIDNFTLPSIEAEFNTDLTLGPSMDVESILKHQSKNLDGFAGTIIDVVAIVMDVVEFVDGVLTAIGNFFAGVWEDFVKAAECFWAWLTGSTEELERERLEAFLKEQAQKSLGIIFAKGVEKIKKDLKHVKAISEIKTKEAREKYVFKKVWREVKKDAFIKQSFLALESGNYKLMDKNVQIAESLFDVVNSAVTGVQLEDAFVAGNYIKVALDMRQEKTPTQAFMDKWFGQQVQIDGRIEVVLLCNDDIIKKKIIMINEMIDLMAPMSNAYIAELLIPDDLELPEAADWAVQWKIDFVGDIMDVPGKVIPIKITYEQLQDSTVLEEVQSVAIIPEIGKLKTKGDKVKDQNGKKAYPQGGEVSVFIPVKLADLPPDTEFITGLAYTKLIYNGKAIGKSPKKTFKIFPRHVEKGGRNVETKITLPKADNYEDSALGGVWKVFSYIKIEGMTDKERRGTSIRVFNNNKQYTALDTTQSIAAPEDLKENESSEATADDSNMSQE
jgi:hypothetical protein